MGNDIHRSEFANKFNILGKEHLFHVVPDSFPTPEDGIIGQNFISKYRHALTNTHLILGNKGIPLRTNVTLTPEIENPSLTDTIKALGTKIRLYHVESRLRIPLEK
ncbi:unnamed protein product [Heterotrigona itama]|uniref:Uncharacterized protein n=1 Tax=Heterotrigona itama TaxID=395501 RepID=A0A6V7GZH6_9HYME|nr:unnamed protein product [Heterotrigona itama]